MLRLGVGLSIGDEKKTFRRLGGVYVSYLHEFIYVTYWRWVVTRSVGSHGGPSPAAALLPLVAAERDGGMALGA